MKDLGGLTERFTDGRKNRGRRGGAPEQRKVEAHNVWLTRQYVTADSSVLCAQIMVATMKKKCYIIAGPNGAGKTTFAETYLPIEGRCLNFVNADLIAAGLSPLNPDLVSFEAGRILLARIEHLANRGESFAYETILSGLGYRRRIKSWKKFGYHVTIYFLKLPSVDLAIERVRLRVSEGGHNVPESDIRRRYVRGWRNFENYYKILVDSWIVFDNSTDTPRVMEKS